MIKRDDFVAWFSDLSIKDAGIAGQRGAGLAEMYRNKFPVPPGFVVTTDAYKYFTEKTGINNDIKRLLSELNPDDMASLNKVSARIRDLIEGSKIPQELEEEILEAYGILDSNKIKEAGLGASEILRTSHERPFVAVRSSATTEDLDGASFAGQHETFLSVKGEKELIGKIKKCFSSLYTARAIYYRYKKGFEHGKAFTAVVIQRMIDSDKSGVIFSRNPIRNDGNLVIEAVYGLGEGVSSGMILPDHYLVNPRNDFDIAEKNISDKKIALVRNSAGEIGEVKLTKERSRAEVLNQYELKRLSQFALSLEAHYKKPQNIEFAIESGEFYILESRPITTKAKESDSEIEGNVLLTGQPASQGIISGAVRIINTLEDLEKIKRGDILVTEKASPEMAVMMQRCAGIITNEGGATSHYSIISREMGIPAVVGTKTATEKLKEGEIVSIDGFTGRVVEGRAEEKKTDIKPIVETRTKIKIIVASPDYAERAARSGADGIGLVKLESLIAEKGAHPLFYLKKDKLDEYIGIIYDGLKKMALYFSDMWIRISDMKSDEYKNLESAPKNDESNPMLGYHGIRFSLKNQDLLEAEFKAVKEVADEFPKKKFGVMLPHVISVQEVREAKKIFRQLRMPENVKFGVAIETPAAAWSIKEICAEGIDFVNLSINELTQHMLALDRNNPEIQELYDEMHPSVLKSIAYVIRICNSRNVETSACGCEGSREEMTSFMVRNKIGSISVSADAAERVSRNIADAEKDIAAESAKEKTISDKTEKDVYDRADGVGKIINPSEINQNFKSNTNEEELILKALESENANFGNDDYNSGFSSDKDVPPLNEAIPVTSELLENDKAEGAEEIEINNVSVPAPEIAIMDINELADAALEAEVIEEVEESNAREEEAKKQKHKHKNTELKGESDEGGDEDVGDAGGTEAEGGLAGGEELLDIF